MFDEGCRKKEKLVETMQCLPNILFNIDIMDLCLLCCFCIAFKRRLESVEKSSYKMSEVVTKNLKSSNPIDAY